MLTREQLEEVLSDCGYKGITNSIWETFNLPTRAVEWENEEQRLLAVILEKV